MSDSEDDFAPSKPPPQDSDDDFAPSKAPEEPPKPKLKGEEKKAQDLEALARKATAWRRTRPSSSQSSPHSSARSETRCDWSDDQLAALAAQLHTPVMEVKAAFEAGDEAALQLGGRPLPPSPRTPGPR